MTFQSLVTDLLAATAATDNALENLKQTAHEMETDNNYTALIPNPDICPLTLGDAGDEGADFIIYEMDGHGWHWEGNSDRCGEFCSEDGHQTDRYCVADALFELTQLVLDYDEEQALDTVAAQGLPFHQILEIHGLPTPC